MLKQLQTAAPSTLKDTSWKLPIFLLLLLPFLTNDSVIFFILFKPIIYPREADVINIDPLVNFLNKVNLGVYVIISLKQIDQLKFLFSIILDFKICFVLFKTPRITIIFLSGYNAEIPSKTGTSR